MQQNFGRYLVYAILLNLSWTTNSVANARSGLDPTACSYRGQPLFGRVQVVERFPDLKVAVVAARPDLRVQIVSGQPDRCGKWQFVEQFGQLRVQFVEQFADLEIQFVPTNPGL